MGIFVLGGITTHSSEEWHRGDAHQRGHDGLEPAQHHD